MFSWWKKKPTRSQSLIHPNRIEYLLTTCDAHKLNLARSPLFYLRSLCWRSAQHRFGRSEDFGNGRECGHCGEHRQAAGVATKDLRLLSQPTNQSSNRSMSALPPKADIVECDRHSQ